MADTTKAGVKEMKALADLEKLIAESIAHWTEARNGIQASLVGVVSLVQMTKAQTHTAHLVNLLLEGLGDGVNGNAIREWTAVHLNMCLTKDNKMGCKKYDLTKISTTKVAAASLWYTFKVQKPTVFDLDAQIISLLKSATTKAGKDLSEMPAGSRVDIDDAALQALTDLATAAEARVATRVAARLAEVEVAF